MKLTYKTPSGVTYYPYLLDMISNNHVLIAGTTGAGKSVLENAIIHSLLAVKHPGGVDGCKFVFIDPKKVELDIYKNLPHVIAYADNIPDILQALYNIRLLIDKRLEVMKKQRQRKTAETPIYIFIDELVDIVTNKPYGKEAIRIISDCASISRATNIFFIALTQSPSRVIIPAQFKLLFNCRVALFCNNAIESRQIIDTNEAVDLPRHGLAIVQQNIDRYMIQIPLIPDEKIFQLVRFWEKQHSFYNALQRRKTKL